ncbi:flagellar hook assembly protein FlgD, partial [Flavobacterium sp. IR1]
QVSAVKGNQPANPPSGDSSDAETAE